MSEPTNFLIIGGGIAAASVGYWLAPHGRVTLLEREPQPGYHATGRSAALFMESYGTPQVRALTMASRAFLQSPPEGFAEHPLLGPRGAMMVATHGQDALLAAHWDILRAMTPHAQLLDSAGACARVPALRPGKVLGAVYEPEAADMDVHAIHQGYLRGLRQAGGRVVCDAEVTALARVGGLWRAQAGGQVYEAPVVLNAAGAWADVVAALAGHALGGVQRPSQPRLPVGEDARLGASWSGRIRPVMFVLIVGETARAQNFSLNGYARPTNPLLARQDVISFPHATACGTSTEVSLPCMFSPYGRIHYDEEKIRGHESVLHVLARAGFKVLWRDNQSGCKGVCDGLPAEQLDDARVEALCAEGHCLDEVLLQGMEGVARDTQGNLLVVMHQLGSHGPAYFKRYPAVFRQFAPACQNEDLSACTAAEIVNAYDNSLLYTDFFVSKVIDFLAAAQQQYDTAMVYVSDHGESLGEGGLYLHGMPYPIAPEVQKRVPLVIWLSPGFRRSFNIDQECLRKNAGAEVGHDNLFHSLLGVLDVQTRAYDKSLDLFAPCRPAPAPVMALSGPENAH